MPRQQVSLPAVVWLCMLRQTYIADKSGCSSFFYNCSSYKGVTLTCPHCMRGGACILRFEKKINQSVSHKHVNNVRIRARWLAGFFVVDIWRRRVFVIFFISTHAGSALLPTKSHLLAENVFMTSFWEFFCSSSRTVLKWLWEKPT